MQDHLLLILQGRECSQRQHLARIISSVLTRLSALSRLLSTRIHSRPYMISKAAQMSLTNSVLRQTSAETAHHSPLETTVILHYMGHPLPLLQASFVSRLCLHDSVSWPRQQLYSVCNLQLPSCFRSFWVCLHKPVQDRLMSNLLDCSWSRW